MRGLKCFRVAALPYLAKGRNHCYNREHKDSNTQMDRLSMVVLRIKPLTDAFGDLRCDIACDAGQLCL